VRQCSIVVEASAIATPLPQPDVAALATHLLSEIQLAHSLVAWYEKGA
jgi:hypothetical protein